VPLIPNQIEGQPVTFKNLFVLFIRRSVVRRRFRHRLHNIRGEELLGKSIDRVHMLLIEVRSR
jgi:hypothetical protein